MLRILAAIIVIIVVALAFTMYRFVSASHDPAVWHVDPQVAEMPLTPNFYLVAPQEVMVATVSREAPQYSTDVPIVAKAFHEFIIRQSNIAVVAGSVDEGWITYVQRTPVLRIPDYITFKFLPLEDGASTVIIYSRSRFGYGDMGVNQARVDGWLESVASFERAPQPIVLRGAGADTAAGQ